MNWRELLGLQPRMQDFAARLLGEARRQQPDANWTHEPDQNVLKTSSGSSVNLGNIFHEYANARRSSRRALFDKYLTMLSASGREIPKLWTLAAKGIYPSLRSKYDCMVLDIEARSDPTAEIKTVSWPFVDDVHIRLMFDFGQMMGHVSRSLLETWGKDEETIRQQALDNLRSLPLPQWIDLGLGVYKIQSEVAYEETFLLLDKAVDQLPFAQHGVFMPVNRGVLLAADSRSEEALGAMLNEAFRSTHENPWPISSLMLIRTAGVWRKFKPSGPNALLARAVDSISIAGTYKDQQDALDKHFQSIGEDIFVATCDLRKRSDDIATIFSWCTWSQGVRSLLPKTDAIVLGRGEEIENMSWTRVDWADAHRICGHYLQATTEDPQRFRVTDFPNEAEWQQLVAVGESFD